MYLRHISVFLFVLATSVGMSACTPDPPTVEVTISPESVTLTVGQTTTLSAASTDTADAFTWTSSDADVATVDNTGLVTAIAEGTAEISATGTVSGATASAVVMVNRDDGEAPTAPLVNPESVATREAKLRFEGTADPNVLIEVSGGTFFVSTNTDNNGAFDLEVPLKRNRINRILFSAVKANGLRSAPTPIEVIQDMTAPKVFIDFPSDGAVLQTDAIAIAGRVSDMHSGFLGLEVTVNGVAASVDEGIGSTGSFERGSVPLSLGENIITATAEDALGNVATSTVTITREAVTGPRMSIISGNEQTGTVLQELAEPLVVQVTDADGAPIANKTVTFTVLRSDGALSGTAGGEKRRPFQVRTDANGRAQAFWRLGTDAGRGNNRLEVTSRDINGSVYFCASADAAPANQINISMGNYQVGEAGAQLPEFLSVWVSDGDNPAGGVEVEFTVTKGDGFFTAADGAKQTTAITDRTGHARIAYTLDEAGGNNHIEATFDGNEGLPATFVAFGLERNEDQPTSFTGVVQDNLYQGIGGAEVFLTVNGEEELETTTDANGLFEFVDIPAGPGELHVEGAPATLLNGDPVPVGTFPALHYEVVVVPNAENSLPRPILLPELDPENYVTYDGTQDVELTVAGVEGIRMRVQAGSVTNPDGSIPSPEEPIQLSLNQVHFDDIPMPLPDGAAPPFAWTLQPGGTHFDPPVEVTYPNMNGLAPGAVAYFLSFNHDTNRFEIVSSATVTEDGAEIVSDPGGGIEVAGWGGNCPPYTVTGIVKGILDDPDFIITLFANGQPYRVDEDGVYCIFNISAPDQFGAGGPGTPPDFISDDRISLIGVGIGRKGTAVEGQVKYYSSAPFLLNQGETVTINSFSGGAAPPPFPKRLFVDADPITFNPGGASQATTTAEFFDGRLEDVTPVSSGTTYRVSNPDIITIDNEALITSYNRGPGFVTASYQGVTATRRVNIALETITTTVEGFVVDENGNPIEGADITSISFGGDFTTDENGFFSFEVTLPAGTQGIVVVVTVGEIDFDSGLVPVVPNGITDVGILSNEPTPFSTTVSGTVQFEGGIPAQGAEVFTNLGGSGITGANGAFSFAVTGAYDNALPSLDVTARLIGEEDNFSGQVTGLDIVDGGTTDAGVIIIRAAVAVLYPALRSPFGGPAQDVEKADLNGDGLMDLIFPIRSTVSSNRFSRISVALSNGDGSYQALEDQDLGENPVDLVLADFNGDGRLDAAVADAELDLVFILLCNGDGTFEEPTGFGAGPTPQRVDAGDLDGDGTIDLVTGNSGDSSVSVLLGNGDGTFQEAVNIDLEGNNIISVALGDMNGDGDLDLIVANRATNEVEYHQGNGDGTFAESVAFATDPAPDQLVIADFNGDSNLDVAAGTFNNGVSLLLGDGAGGFAEKVAYPTAGNIRDLAAADFDDNGALDLLVASSSGNFELMAILFNDGNGVFEPEFSLPVPRFTRIATADDADQDGNIDVLAVIGSAYGDVSVIRGLGAGAFEVQGLVPTGNFGNTGLEAVDMNGDGEADLVTVRNSDDAILVLLGDGNAGFMEPMAFDLPSDVLAMTVANINNDGALDVITAHRNPDQIGVSLGNGDGTLQAPFFLAAEADVRNLAIGDIDRDGVPDILSTPGPNFGFEVRLGIDGQSFNAPYEINAQNSVQNVFIGDVDGDNNLDVLAPQSNAFALFLGNGDGSFASPRNLQISGASAVIRDLNGDGIADIATGDRDSIFSVMLGNGEGFFDAALRFDVADHRDPARLEYLRIADLNADGNLDAVFSYDPFQCVGVLLGDGTGFFSGFTRYDLGGTFTSGIAVADVNNDGQPDVLGSNSGSNDISVLLHR